MVAENRAVPLRMRAVVVERPGEPDAMTVGSLDVPTARPDEVLIRVEAAGVNRPDVLQRQGHYPPPADANPLLGLEVAGTVVAAGDAVRMLAVGDRVAALVNGGGYAEYCVAPAGQCLRFPDSYDAIRAAALPETCFTVWANVFEPLERSGAGLAPGETLLVHGGTSGIGLTAIQIAREARDATVLATVGSEAKCEAVRRAGATAINYRDRDFVDAVREATEGRGADVILDIVGGPYLRSNLRCLARDGRLSLIGMLGGSVAESVDLTPIMTRRLKVIGSTMRARSGAEKAVVAQGLLDEVWPLLDEGRIAPVIEETFPIGRVADAHRLMESSRHVGKLVLTFD